LIHALTSDLLTSEFIPLNTSAQAARSQDQRPRIGIVWASIDKKPIKKKSVPVKEFLNTLAGVEADFVSFQRKLQVADPDCLLRKFGARVVADDVLDAKNQRCLDNLMQEIRQLDCMVTTSTTTTHIAGSMGIRVELITAERAGQQWFWQVQANHRKNFYPTVTVHLGNGEIGKWWERCLEPVKTSIRRKLERADERVMKKSSIATST
jgi:hypothetical protein